MKGKQHGEHSLAQQVAESGAVKKSGPGPPLLLLPMDAAETVPCDGMQPATVLPLWATRAEKGFTTCCMPPRQNHHMAYLTAHFSWKFPRCIAHPQKTCTAPQGRLLTRLGL